MTYEPFGSISGWTWGNGTVVTRAYDEDGNTTTVASGGETDSYAYDAAYRITSDTNVTNGNYSWTYGFDALDRLTSANNISWQETFTFDANGNRLTQGASYTSLFTISPTSNRISATSGYTLGQLGYDASGNVVSATLGTTAYNAAGRVITITDSQNGASLHFIYDAMGMRIHKTSPLGTFDSFTISLGI